jgi:hypothetical protein
MSNLTAHKGTFFFLDLIECTHSYAIKTLSVISRPGTKALCSSEIRIGRILLRMVISWKPSVQNGHLLLGEEFCMDENFLGRVSYGELEMAPKFMPRMINGFQGQVRYVHWDGTLTMIWTKCLSFYCLMDRDGMRISYDSILLKQMFLIFFRLL